MNSRADEIRKRIERRKKRKKDSQIRKIQQFFGQKMKSGMGLVSCLHTRANSMRGTTLYFERNYFYSSC